MTRKQPRHVETFEHRPAAHILESETVDLDNRSFHFEAFGHSDPHVVTVVIGTESRTLTRAAMREGFARIIAAIDTLPPAT